MYDFLQIMAISLLTSFACGTVVGLIWRVIFKSTNN